MANIIQELMIYPIKSLNGLTLSKTELKPEGLRYDRQWMLVDKGDRFITRREFPALAKLEVSMSEDALVIKSESDQVSIGLKEFGIARHEVKSAVWNSPVVGNEVSHEANQLLSDFLGQEIRLIRKSSNLIRREPIPDSVEYSISSFADSFPVHVLGTASMDALNEVLETPVDIHYFRPNILIQTTKPFEEEEKRVLGNDGVILYQAKSCGRCKMINVNPRNGEVRTDVLRVLAQLRQQKNKVTFGALYYPNKTGFLAKGDWLEDS